MAARRAAILLLARHHATSNGSLSEKNKPGTFNAHSVSISWTEDHTMFEQALLESAKHTPGARRAYSTGASLLLQSSALAAFIIVPLLTTQIVPTLQQRSFVLLPSFAPPTPPGHSGTEHSGNRIFVAARPLLLPSPLRHTGPTHALPDDPVAPTPTPGTGVRGLNAAIGTGPSAALPENPATKRPPVSVLEQGVVLSRVQPLYPHIAVVNRVQGTVHLNAVITPSGTLEELHVLSGHPMLAQAAIEAVRQWRFRPYVLNGNPIEVQTNIVVNFSLN
jgi:protein TonB